MNPDQAHDVMIRLEELLDSVRHAIRTEAHQGRADGERTRALKLVESHFSNALTSVALSWPMLRADRERSRDFECLDPDHVV